MIEKLTEKDRELVKQIRESRYIHAEKLRAQGMTLKNIGIELGVCTVRARQILLKMKRIREEGRRMEPFFELRMRTRNIISRLVSSGHVPTPHEVKELIINKKLNYRTNRVGRMTMRDIALWLERHKLLKTANEFYKISSN